MLTRDYNIYECNRCKHFQVTAPKPVEFYCKHFNCPVVGEGSLTHPPDGCPGFDRGRPTYIKRETDRKTW